MINTIDQFGRNAGMVYSILSKEETLPIDEIANKTHLRMYEAEMAIGWLARENKISLSDGKYRLSETNLTSSIGANAGMIWRLLDTHGKSTVNQLIKESMLPIQELYKAIGWLAREEKINIEIE